MLASDGLVCGNDYIILLQVRRTDVPVIAVVEVCRKVALGDVVCDLLLPIR